MIKTNKSYVHDVYIGSVEEVTDKWTPKKQVRTNVVHSDSSVVSTPSVSVALWKPVRVGYPQETTPF